MIVDDKLWHVCFAAGEDGRYNELVEADFPTTADCYGEGTAEDWREDASFTISAIRIIFGRVAESNPIDAQDCRKGTKFRFHAGRQCDYGMAKRPCIRCEARR